MLSINNYKYYYQKVIQKVGWAQNAQPFPVSSTIQDNQQRVMDIINETLIYFNQQYWLAFQEREYQLTTITGINDYDLTIAPFSQIYWRANRMGRNACVRLTDDIVLTYIDYSELDFLKPDISLAATPFYWTQFAGKIRFWPKPNGIIIKIRYYSTAIGTDVTGTTQLINLINATDLPNLQDEWGPALIYGAAAKLRLIDKSDQKTGSLQAEADKWESMLADHQKAGEDVPVNFNFRNTKMNWLSQKLTGFLYPPFAP